MKSAAAILGLAAIMGGLDMPLRSSTARSSSPSSGHKSWGRAKSPKVRDWRKKEKAAKQARKLNWN